MKEKIASLISKEIKLDEKEIEKVLEVPPSPELGDFSFPCFTLAKNLRKNPLEIASELTEKFRKKLPSEISGVDFKGAYVNFFIDKKVLAKNVLKNVGKKGFGVVGKNNGKIVIDMSSPNIAKPFGIGHLRSTIIGNSIAKICEANGFDVVKINYLGDWGTQFGKIIFGYKKWGDAKKLLKDPIKHLNEIYVKANDEEYEEESRSEFKKLESNDKENLELWEKFRKLSLEEFNKIYELLGIKFDLIDGESNYNSKMDEIVEELKKKKLVKKDDGALVVDLTSECLGVSLIQKSDGTSLYTTRDLALAISRYNKYKFKRGIYEVGSEQKLHFKQLFIILKKMGYSWSKDLVHVAHGLYLDKDGKKFSTRKGKTVFMKDVLDEVFEKAKKNLSLRDGIKGPELDKRASSIGIAAIFYGDLSSSRESNVVFDIDRFLKFEGDTGPYLLYSYARASSIVRKVKKKGAVKILDLKDEEISLLKKISHFEDIVKKAYDELAPNLIANYSFELAKSFNEFYHACPVVGSIEEPFRLALVDAFMVTIKKSLDLLGIDVLEKM